MNEEFDMKTKRISILDTYGENFLNKTYITNPAIGRDVQIKELILTLLTPDKSAVLVGKPGVGKTAIVEGLAYRIQNGLVPDGLSNYQVIKVNTSALLGVDPVTGEAKVQTLIDEIKSRTNLILFIDEIHILIGAGGGGGAMDAANILKPALARGELQTIGATTLDEYRQYESHHKRRLSMKPGITGLWQVSGRSDIDDFEEVVKLDVQYIDNWSIWMDIYLLFRTVGVVFDRKGAK